MIGHPSPAFGLLRRGRHAAVCLIVMSILSGCGTSSPSEPIGIGPDRDNLKRSPCACVEIPQRSPLRAPT